MQSTPPPDFHHASFHGKIGVARSDITPPIGIYARNWGAALHDTATSIHRPLTLTALTCSPMHADKATGGSSHDGNMSSRDAMVLIDADLGWWKTPQASHTFTHRLLDALALEPDRCLFALSHTHSGPPLMEVDTTLPGSDLLEQWMEQLLYWTVRTVRTALDNSFEATLDWHRGRCGLAVVRDLPDPNPTVGNRGRVICGYLPSGKPDDTLIVGRITDASGKIRATLTNYACHPTTLAWQNSAISPDYVGAMRETMQNVTQAPALFLLGACGDLAPRHQYVGDHEIADRHGRQLAYASLAVLHDMEPPGTRLTFTGTVESGAPLAVWQHADRASSRHLQATQVIATLPIKPWPSADELEQQRIECKDRALEERLRRKRDIRRSLGEGSTFDLPIHVWRIGDAVLVGSCCEPYSALQQELRRRFPNHTIVCMNLINGSLGYLPPAELYDTEVYPVWQTPFDRGSFEQTLETMAQAIHDVLR